jgi:hypothetical protein
MPTDSLDVDRIDDTVGVQWLHTAIASLAPSPLAPAAGLADDEFMSPVGG